jgi:ParB/RepB/Spo0J family partition protein
MKLEFHQLDRRYEHLRLRNPQRQQRLLASLATAGQQTPIVVVALTGKPDGYRVIDGHKRMAALEQLGRDTVDAVVWSMSEGEALVLERSMHFSERETALEQGWLLAELEQRFGYSLDDLARRFDRSVSWVSRRLALVELLPEQVQEQVRRGEISAHVAMKYLVPVTRTHVEDAKRMATGFAAHRFNSRQAGQLYAAWREASAEVRQRILDQPQLFLKAHQQVDPPPSSLGDELVRDLNMVLAITQRAGRRLACAAPLMGRAQIDDARHKIECVLNDLRRLEQRIGNEEEHVEQKSADHDSGTSQPECEHARDCTGPGIVAPVGAQGPALELLRVTGAGAGRESRGLPGADPGVVGQLQRQSRAGP